jgi:glyoxylase-like metal-dependent hydrolase (beta-lactamase superfamily II)
MLKICSIESAAFRSRTYVVIDPPSGCCLVVDPGDPDIRRVETAFRAEQVLGCDYILLTHEHFDHIGGAARLRESTRAPIVASRACAEACRDSRKNMSYYLNGKGFELEAVYWICEERGWTIPWAEHLIEITPCPGHSPGGVVIRVEQCLFTGDSLLATGPGPTHLPGGNKAGLTAALEELHRKYPGQMRVYPGHGESFPLEPPKPC